MRAKSLIIVPLCLIVATACTQKSPTGPTAVLNGAFALAPGQTASIDGTSLRVTFQQVSGDSRCPADALCIQGGDALVHIRAGSAGVAREYELHTGDSSRAAIMHDGFQIALVNLQPYPFSSRTIQPDEYRATLRVSH